VKQDTIKIGEHIRKLRRHQHRTLQEIADECEFTKSLLSKIETGSVLPPVATLVKIARALGTTVSSLIEEEHNTKTVYETKEEIETKIVQTEKGYSIFPFASAHKEKKMQPFLFEAKRGETQEHHLSHNGEEFIYVVEGVMKFQVGSVTYELKEGDSLYFEALDSHGVTPVSERVRYLDVFV
jgi:quercetin dioxygenase-like cupin family protein